MPSIKLSYTGAELDVALGRINQPVRTDSFPTFAGLTVGTLGTKNPPIDADLALYRDSAAANVLVTSTWTQIKAFLKSFFDTIYAAVAHKTSHQDGGSDEISVLGLSGLLADYQKPAPFEMGIAYGALIGIQEFFGKKWADLGQQAAQTEILSLAYLGNGIALAGTCEGGKILRSTDYGATWADLGQQAAQTHIFSLAYLGNGIALAGTYPNGKILRSINYGATWADLGQQAAQTHILSLAYLGNGIALAGTIPNGKILRSNW
ncbi:MAG: hypothetical protein QME78_11240 [Thermodesulfobacteriota bacterium]|nr:hypothetical protein [Thermodesulfobacteriota bacterium]